MSEDSDFDRRLRAVERALTDGDHDVAALQDAAARADRLDDLEDRIGSLEERIAELDAATEAVRGYVGNVRSVNEDVERRADAALAAVDRLEARLDGEQRKSGTRPSASTTIEGGGATSAVRNGTLEPSHDSPETDQYGIEMPPPGANAAADGRDEENDDGTSVIERVREVL